MRQEMDAVYPPAASALTRGRRWRRAEPKLRHHTMPVTFAEIKEVDEENEVEEKLTTASASNVSKAADDLRRRPDVFDETLRRRFVEFRHRRSRKRRDVIREPDEIEETKHNEAESDAHPT